MISYKTGDHVTEEGETQPLKAVLKPKKVMRGKYLNI